jgi:cytochrome c biogenesis protein CcdA/thiol-disulfide isomerase/thioredoxin
MILLLISFIAGILTVLAPCVLPLLPVIVGGSLTDGKVHLKRALTVTLALGVSVIAFTFILKVSTLFITIPQQVWTGLSATILIVFGLITLFPHIWDKLTVIARLNRSSNQLLGQGYQKQNIWGDIIVGASLGPVFSTCSPTYFIILATVLPARPLEGFIDLLAYTVGLCGALLGVALIGQKIIDRLGLVSDPKSWFKRGLGILFIIIGIIIALGIDKTLEARILTAGFFDITRIEQHLLQNIDVVKVIPPPSPFPQIAATSSEKNPEKGIVSTPQFLTLPQKAGLYRSAPELVQPAGYVNTAGAPITVAQFKGKKVVLLDIWTYSCINCQRTIPYLNDWYKKYHDQGLEIIGIHTPEFSFEKKQSNVEDAVRRFGIQYPVILDNNYTTWNALHNQYWPRKYLVDVDGFIVYDHIGEGEYELTEQQIQKALAELHVRQGGTLSAASPTFSTPANAITVETNKVRSPETYFGAARNEFLANGVQGIEGAQMFTVPSSTAPNTLYLGGTWNIQSEYAEYRGDAHPTAVLFRYQAKNVYMVASAPSDVIVDVYVDSKLAGSITINSERLYTVVQGTDYAAHTLELRPRSSGLKAFTFTFG